MTLAPGARDRCVVREARREVVASYGVGGASLEWWLTTLRPDRKLIMTDYGEATVERLAEVFPEADVRQHDLRQDEPLPADIHLFHRIETELGNHEWCDAFGRFGRAEIVLVAADFLDLGGLAGGASQPTDREGASRNEGWVHPDTRRRRGTVAIDALGATAPDARLGRMGTHAASRQGRNVEKPACAF